MRKKLVLVVTAVVSFLWLSSPTQAERELAERHVGEVSLDLGLKYKGGERFDYGSGGCVAGKGPCL